jgi:hypothetical protein
MRNCAPIAMVSACPSAFASRLDRVPVAWRVRRHVATERDRVLLRQQGKNVNASVPITNQITAKMSR